jgi:hypothetical protein
MNLMQQLTTVFIPSGQAVIKYTENHILITTNVRTLLTMPIANWKRNRPPDIERCKEIARDISKNRPMLDSLFYFHFVNGGLDLSGNAIEPRFECLDGIHRYTALSLLHKEYSQPPDLLEFDEDVEMGKVGNIDWLYGRSVLLNIRSNCTEEVLTEIFRNINNCVPVPLTYLEEYDERKRKCAETITFDWQSKYRSHFVVEKNTQFKPHRPNTTYPRVVNLVSDIYELLRDREAEDCDLTSSINALLETANVYIQNHLTMGVSPKILEKCQKTGCYLFLCKSDEILQIIGRFRDRLAFV